MIEKLRAEIDERRARHVQVSPDGVRYRAMGRGERVSLPFAARWLVPFVFGDDPKAWRAMTYWALPALVAVVALMASWTAEDGDGWLAAAVAALVMAQLPGVVDIHLRFPMLVDLPAMLLAAISAALAARGSVEWSVAVAILAGCTKETGPLFAASWAFAVIPGWGAAWPLLGLVGSLGSRLFAPKGDELPELAGSAAAEAVTRPWRTNKMLEKRRWRDFERWIGSWGIGLVGFLWPPAWPALGLGYAQCALATDRARLYQWAGPAVAVGAAIIVTDPAWLLPLAALAIWRPWPVRGDNI